MEQTSGTDWAKMIERDLLEDGERVPFDRVLQRHLDATQTLRERGLTWSALARFLMKAGARRGDGQPYTADHLRVSFSRLRQGNTGDADHGEDLASVLRDPKQRPLPHSNVTDATQRPARPGTTGGDMKRRKHTDQSVKEVSTDEIAIC